MKLPENKQSETTNPFLEYEQHRWEITERIYLRGGPYDNCIHTRLKGNNTFTQRWGNNQHTYHHSGEITPDPHGENPNGLPVFYYGGSHETLLTNIVEIKSKSRKEILKGNK